MRKLKVIALILVVMLAATLFISCGAKNEGETTTGEGSVVGDVSSESSAPTLNIDTKATVDTILGSWVDVSDSSRFANITKSEDGNYTWEDNEGKYKATFKEGALTINVNDSETATAYYDAKSGQLVCVYGGQETRFTKK